MDKGADGWKVGNGYRRRDRASLRSDGDGKRGEYGIDAGGRDAEAGGLRDDERAVDRDGAGEVEGELVDAIPACLPTPHEPRGIRGDRESPRPRNAFKSRKDQGE